MLRAGIVLPSRWLFEACTRCIDYKVIVFVHPRLCCGIRQRRWRRCNTLPAACSRAFRTCIRRGLAVVPRSLFLSCSRCCGIYLRFGLCSLCIVSFGTPCSSFSRSFAIIWSMLCDGATVSLTRCSRASRSLSLLMMLDAFIDSPISVC